jgi:hypothetical protein
LNLKSSQIAKVQSIASIIARAPASNQSSLWLLIGSLTV